MKDGKALTGNSLTEFGKYTIEKSYAPMVVNDMELETYNLVYENTKNPIQVGLFKGDKKCTIYIVRSDEFEIQYKCDKGVFGVKKIEDRFHELPKNLNNAKLNKRAYFAQKVITQNEKSEEDLLGLIACYFPNLVNEEYQASF
jgi:hypothetical protein